MIRKLTKCAIFAALAIVVSTLEMFIPIQSIIPVPGIKLGLSNCIVLFIMYTVDFKSAITVSICKCIVVSILFSGPVSLVYSLSGALTSAIIMKQLIKFNKFFSIFGVSVAGSAAHCFAQTAVAALILGSVYVLKYLTLLLPVSIATGIIVGLIAEIMIKRIKR